MKNRRRQIAGGGFKERVPDKAGAE